MTSAAQGPSLHVPTARFQELREGAASREGGAMIWTAAAQNFITQWIVAPGPAAIEFADSGEEQMIVLCGELSAATVTSEAGGAELRGETVAVLPPGPFRVALEAGARMARLATHRHFAADRFDFDARVAAVAPWGLKSGRSTLRVYRLGDVPRHPSRFGRIFLCAVGMINVFSPDEGPRDDSALTPHSHDDFEQITLQVSGDYVHHIRIPWTPRLADWRPDEHRMLTSPAMTFIPARAIHTSQGVHPGRHQLIDVFAPPRLDWANKPGWVLNGDEYLLPESSKEDGT